MIDSRGLRAVLASAVVGFGAAFAVITYAPAATAQAAPKRVVAVYSEGPEARKAFEAVKRALPDALIADYSVSKDILKKSGLKTPLKGKLKTANGRADVASKLQAQIGSAGVSAMVITFPPVKGKKGSAGVMVVAAGNASPLVSESALPRDGFAGVIAGPINGTAAPTKPAAVATGGGGGPTDEPEGGGDDDNKGAAAPPASGGAAATTTTTTTTTASTDSGSTAPAGADDEGMHGVRKGIVVLDVGIGLAGRHFAATDVLTKNLRSYSLSAAPQVEAGLELYPFAPLHTPFLSDFGFIGQYTQAFGLASSLPDGSKPTTKWHSYTLGAKYRIRAGHAVLLGIEGEYVRNVFTFSPYSQSTGTGAPDVVSPTVDYQGGRVGLDGRITIGGPALLLGVGLQHMLSKDGTLKPQFPHESAVNAFDANLGVAVPLVGPLEARAQLFYERYGYTFNPVVGDGYFAGGAVDQMYGLRIGVAVAP